MYSIQYMWYRYMCTHLLHYTILYYMYYLMYRLIQVYSVCLMPPPPPPNFAIRSAIDDRPKPVRAELGAGAGADAGAGIVC